MFPMLKMIVLLILSGSTLVLAEETKTVQVPAHSYVPKGFDSNDNAQIIVSGYLPNLCYYSPFSTVKVEGTEIHISMQAYVMPSPFCSMSIVPYLEVVNLGVLPKGQYTIHLNEESRVPHIAKLGVIEPETTGRDDFIYANATSIRNVVGTRKIRIYGVNPSSCFEFSHFKIYDNGLDVYSVLPIMKQITQVCPQTMKPFMLEFTVPTKLTAREVLLHVRTMNGNSLNLMFDES